jgi:hypothetical protein
MFNLLLRVIGLLIVADALFIAYRGFEAFEHIQSWEAEIGTREAHIDHEKLSKEEGEKRLVWPRAQLEERKTYRNIQLSVAVGALILGLGLILFPSSRKTRKAPAAPVST